MEMVSMERLFANVVRFTDGYGDDWQEMVYEKSFDPSFWQLCDMIPVEGMRHPIGICINAVTGKWAVHNGHHRLAAAVMLVLPEVPVYFWDGMDHRALWDSTDPGDDGYGVPNAQQFTEQQCETMHAALFD